MSSWIIPWTIYYLKDERIPLKNYCKQFSLIVIMEVIDNTQKLASNPHKLLME